MGPEGPEGGQEEGPYLPGRRNGPKGVLSLSFSKFPLSQIN